MQDSAAYLGLTESDCSVTPLVPGFVGQFRCGPLSDCTDCEVFDEIRSAWAKYPVLVFPQQSLNPSELAELSAKLGQFGDDPYVEPLDGHENVIEVRREPYETTPIFGQSWHSDWSFQANPPSGTLLHAQVIPPVGGDTVFASGYKAYETLSPAMQSMLAPLKAIHSARAAYGPRGLFARDDHTRSMKIVVSDDAEETYAHPIVRTHPESGRKSLYINHVYTIGIEGFKANESDALLRFLFEHMTDPAFLYRHRWQANMLVMWDNRCLIHYADGGYEGHQRVMYRTTLAGEQPIPHLVE